LISQRNQYFARAGQNDYEKSNVGIILAPEEDGKKVLWANHLIGKKSNISSEEIKMFCALCDGLLGVVEKIAEEVDERVLSEYKGMNLDDLYKKPKRKHNIHCTRARATWGVCYHQWACVRPVNAGSGC
jgi:hypothetical protein